MANELLGLDKASKVVSAKISLGAASTLLSPLVGGSWGIGGATDYDTNAVALLAIIAEWDQAGVSYGTRVSHLLGGGKGKNVSGGLNGPYLLNGTTVRDDASTDTLIGGSGTDWFLVRTKGITDKDVVTDKVRGETVTQI